MKANELMIGDFLRVNREGLCIKKDTVVQVRGIDGDNKFEEKGLVGCANCRPMDKKQYDGGIWLDYLDPIPITPEILEKNGFVETDVVVVGTRKMIWESEDGRTEITIWMDDTMPMDIRKNIYYEDEICYTLPFACTVHELQHALRLCGIDKEIIV